MKIRLIFVFLIVFFSVGSVFAISDISVFQGQYHNETSFIQGTFEFTFDVYDAGVGGNLVGSHKTNLTTGNWGQWRAEVPGVSYACNDSSKDYFIEVIIDGNVQQPRRRLSHFKYLRKDIEETTSEGLTIEGILKGEVPLKIDKGIQFLENDESIFSIYEAKINDNYANVSSDFYGSLIIETDKMLNPNKMEVCFWDKEDQIMFLCVSEGGQNRATTVRRSFQIVGNTSVKENDEDFTLCENANYIDCSTSTTGADLLVQDDIEAQSIYANENITAVYFIGDGSQLTGLSIIENDTLQTITDRGTVTNNSITIGSVLNFILGGYIQEFVDKFLMSKSLEISGNLNVTGNVSFNGKAVCLEDGTNCLSISDTNCSIDGSCSAIVYDNELNYTIDTDTSASTECSADEVLLGNGSCVSSSGFGGGSGGIQYTSFISTVDGKLNKNDRYLALGTDGGISGSVTEMAWIIDRDMTITGILWDSKSNSRTKTSAITLMSGNNKNSLSDTSLSKDIQGVVSGSDLSFNVSLSQGDVVAIKYDSGGNGGDIEDLSITLIGRYD